MKTTFFILLLFISLVSYGQLPLNKERQIDSLKEVIKFAKHDSVIVNACFDWDDLIYVIDPALDFKLNLRIDSFCDVNLVNVLGEVEKSFFLRAKGSALNNIGCIYKDQDNYEKAIDYHTKSLRVQEEIGNNLGISASLNNLGIIYRIQGNYAKSIVYYTRSLKIKEQIGDKNGIAKSLNNIGVIYVNQGDYAKAIDYFTKSLKLKEELGNKNEIAKSLNNIGSLYTEQKNFAKAMEYHTRSFNLLEEVGNISGAAHSLISIGVIYREQGDDNQAFECFSKSLKIAEEIGEQHGISSALYNIGYIYKERGDYTKALKHSKRSLAIAQEIGDVKKVSSVAELLWEVNKKLGKSKESLKMYELHIVTRDSMASEDNQKSIIQQEYKYAYEKRAAADSVKSATTAKVKDALLLAERAENKRQQFITIAVTVGLALVALFLIFVYRRLQITKKQGKKIEAQKQELEYTHKELEETTNELRDSIDYAELIQDAVLPTLKIEDLTKESFIYFNPKEKVSGDFYWIEQKDEYHGYAVADCTGHGIPGAFISMIGTILLNEIYNSKQIYIPNEILDELSRLVRLTLTNKEGYTMKDGMDISFAVLDNKTKMLYFSGANNPIWIASKNPEKRINKETAVPLIEKDGKYIYEIKGDKQPVGDYGEHVKLFTLNSAHLEEGDVFYLFTDGYVDQFGGDKNKKFKAKPFRELLLSVFNEEMEGQKLILDQNFQNWKGGFEQIDDVTVMGVRV